MEINEFNNQRITKVFLLVLIFTLFFYISYGLFFQMAVHHKGLLGAFPSDIPAHLFLAQTYQRHFLSVIAHDVEPGFHLTAFLVSIIFRALSGFSLNYSYAAGGAFVLAAAKLFFLGILLTLFRFIKGNLAIIVPVLMLVIGVTYLPMINKISYTALGSPSMYHNPTFIYLLPFTYLFFQKITTDYKQKIKPKQVTILTLLLLWCTMIKPAFTNIIIPVFGLFYLLNFNAMKKNTLNYLIIVLPSLLFVVHQLTSMGASGNGRVIFSPFYIYYYYTSHPYYSLFQAILLPGSITLFILLRQNLRRQISTQLKIAWLFFILAYLMFAMLSFSGTDWRAGNFSWSYDVGLSLIYVYSVRDYFYLKCFETLPTWQNITVFIAFNACVISGVMRLVSQLFGASYMNLF